MEAHLGMRVNMSLDTDTRRRPLPSVAPGQSPINFT